MKKIVFMFLVFVLFSIKTFSSNALNQRLLSAVEYGNCKMTLRYLY